MASFNTCVHQAKLAVLEHMCLLSNTMGSLELICMFLLGLLAGGVSGYDYGAPTKICESMTPGHGTEQTSMTDFTMTTAAGLTSSKYTPGQSVTVNIDGLGAQFKGMMLQARHAGATHPYGTWTTAPADTKVMTCSNPSDTMTHSSDTSKPASVNFTWVPPTDCDAGTIKFTATIAMQKDTWWKNIVAAEVMGNYAAGVAACSTGSEEDGAPSLRAAAPMLIVTLFLAIIAAYDNLPK